jgi:hypothetical protein
MGHHRDRSRNNYAVAPVKMQFEGMLAPIFAPGLPFRYTLDLFWWVYGSIAEP